MSALRIAIPTRLFAVPLAEAIEQAATAGVQGIAIDLRRDLPPDLSDSGVRELRHMIGEFGLEIATTEFPLRHRLTERDHLDERVAGLLRGIETAASLGAKSITIPVGRLPRLDDAAKSEADLFREIVGDLSARGDHIVVTPVVRPADSDLDQIAAAVDGFEHAPVGLELDVAALTLFDQSVDGAVRRFHDRLELIRVRDATRAGDGSVVETSVGRGEVDWPAAVAALAEVGYTGWQLVDHHDVGPQAVVEAVRAITFLHNVAYG
ncbi:MAG: sugar phosphate isomerase/epimerase [Planctomycetota bacterium]